MTSLYTDKDFPHAAGEHPLWQESWVLIFRDYATDCVGFVRTGAYVNQGTTQTHWGMALPDGTRFRRHWLDRKLEKSDRTERTASSGSATVSFLNDDYVHFTGNDADAEVDLRFYDYFPSQEWDFIGDILVAPDVASTSSDPHGHPESAGRVEGRVRIGDRTIEIENGIGYRDHGYGPRVITPPFRSARWHAGTVGEALSYSLVTAHSAAGEFSRFGWIMRDGERLKIRDLHTVNCVLGDGFSTIGGWTTVVLDSGETLRIEVATIDGVVTSTELNNGGPGSSAAGIEALSVPRWNGHHGVCDFNMIDNAHRGEQEVSGLFLANHADGLSQRPVDLAWAR